MEEGTFSISDKDHYVRSLEVHRQKSGNLTYNNEFLRLHLPPLIEDMARKQKHEKQFNILSIGSGTGKTDFVIIQIVQKVMDKLGCNVRIFNRAVEPSAASMSLFKQAVHGTGDGKTEFDLCETTFEGYKETKNDAVRFDLIHFVHSTPYLDMEKTLSLCFEEELKPHGIIACFVVGKDLLYRCCKKQGHVWNKGNTISGCWVTGDDIAAVADRRGWKHEVLNQEYTVDVTDVFDEDSEEGNLLLDFLTYVKEFRKTVDKTQVKDMLDLIREGSSLKDGKRLGKRIDQLLFLHK